MGCYSRVFGTGRYVSQTTTCSTDCFNITSPNQNSTQPTIYDDLPVSTSGLAGAIDYYAEQLAGRLGCTFTVTAPTAMQYTIELRRRGALWATVDWQLANQQGAYPLTVGYTRPTPDSQQNVLFQHVLHAIDWLVQRLA